MSLEGEVQGFDSSIAAATPLALPEAHQPTRSTYGELDFAWAHFNAKLFAGRLTPALITLSRANPKSAGWYTPKSFIDAGGQQVGKITLNSGYFVIRPLLGTLAELVHQMVHQAQHQIGRPARGNYHNRQFADWAEAIGLLATEDGNLVGGASGDSVELRIIEGGRFHTAALELLQLVHEGKPYALSWLDRHPESADTNDDWRPVTRAAIAHAREQAKKRAAPPSTPSNDDPGAHPPAPDATLDATGTTSDANPPPPAPASTPDEPDWLSSGERAAPAAQPLMSQLDATVREAVQRKEDQEKAPPKRITWRCPTDGCDQAHQLRLHNVQLTCGVHAQPLQPSAEHQATIDAARARKADRERKKLDRAPGTAPPPAAASSADAARPQTAMS